MIHEFLPIARTVKALSELKIISFGPRPLNFLACNAPIKSLYDLGIEIEENSELDLFEAFNQYELTLKDWIRDHKGYRKYVTIAGKCWPAFQTQFGFVSCYVNSRLAAQGISVSCEVDIYGALSEFIGTVVSQDAVTLLDINNSVPADTKLRAYVAQGEILPVATRSFGFIGVFAILEMGRFYRYVLI